MSEAVTGRITLVWTETVKTELTQDETAGATVLHVDDVSVFNDDDRLDEYGNLGYLYVGAQSVGYTDVDDDASTVTLAEALTADASDGDDVSVWNDIYGQVDTQQWAWVEPDGGDQEDPIQAEVRDEDELVDGDRGRQGEACVIRRRKGSDIWRMREVNGRPSTARGWKWYTENDPAYTLTADDITAGFATIPLKYRPDPESMRLHWLRTLQDLDADYTVDALAQTATLTLEDTAQAGDIIPIQYRYRVGLVVEPPPEPAPVGLIYVSDTFVTHGTTSTNIDSITLTDSEPGDLFAFVAMSDGGGATMECPDPRVAGQPVNSSVDGRPVKVWVGVDDGSGPLLVDMFYDGGGMYTNNFALATIVLRPDSPVTWDLTKVTDSGEQPSGSGSTPGFAGVSGAIIVGAAHSSLGGAYGGFWPSPWSQQDGDAGATYNYVTTGYQDVEAIADTGALTTGISTIYRGFTLGVGWGVP